MEARRRSFYRSGSIYPIVMGVASIVMCLSVAGLEMSRVAGKVNREMRYQVAARRMAQSGLEYWQRQYNAGNMPDPTVPLNIKLDSNSGFYLYTTLSPAGANPKGAAQVTSIGRFGNAVQQLTARFEARPTLFDGYRCAIRSEKDSIQYESSLVDANHWSLAMAETSATKSEIFMDAMTGDSFSGSQSNFKQRRIHGIPWNMQAASLDPSDPSYPGKAYLSAPGAVLIQPPHGDDQLISNSDFKTGVAPWYTTSATIALDATQGYSGMSSAYVTKRMTGDDAPFLEVSPLLVKDHTYQITARVKPAAKAKFRLALNYLYSDSPFPLQFTGSSTNISSEKWNEISWLFTVSATKQQPSKILLGIFSDGNCDFHFDGVTMYDLSRDDDQVYMENLVLSESFNPFSISNSAPATSGIYIVDCRNRKVRIENCRIRSTLVFTHCEKVELRGGIVWEVPNRNYPAILADAEIEDETKLSSFGDNTLRERDICYNLNPDHTPFNGDWDTDFDDAYPCGIHGGILSTDGISLGDGNASRGKIRNLTGPILARGGIAFETTTKSIAFPSDMILNPPPGFYPSFTPMRLIRSSIDEGVGTQAAEVVNGELIVSTVELIPIDAGAIEDDRSKGEPIKEPTTKQPPIDSVYLDSVYLDSVPSGEPVSGEVLGF